MIETGGSNILGVVGGLGPLASAEFLKTLYEWSIKKREQEGPIVFLYSDPTFPDRTDSFLSGEGDEVLERLITASNHLRQMGVSKILVCCVTIHYLFPRLPKELRGQMVSLLDLIFDGVAGSSKKHLLVCSNGSRKLELFESHDGWKAAHSKIILPDERDQDLIHNDLIYQIKQNGDVNQKIKLLESLLAKYGVDSFIAGCTEMHLVAKGLMNSVGNVNKYSCIDPLTIMAKEMAGERI